MVTVFDNVASLWTIPVFFWYHLKWCLKVHSQCHRLPRLRVPHDHCISEPSLYYTAPVRVEVTDHCKWTLVDVKHSTQYTGISCEKGLRRSFSWKRPEVSSQTIDNFKSVDIKKRVNMIFVQLTKSKWLRRNRIKHVCVWFDMQWRRVPRWGCMWLINLQRFYLTGNVANSDMVFSIVCLDGSKQREWCLGKYTSNFFILTSTQI
jgi:hypothetical protein